jgi:hypothetical protein
MQGNHIMKEDHYSFALQPTLNWSMQRIGLQETSVIIIDGVMQQPESLVDYAANEVPFDNGDDGSGGYPGVRAAAPLNYVGAVVKALDPLMRDVFGLGDVTLANAECSLCIVTTPREMLHPLQCVPHIDTTYPLQFAILHYLCASSFGGTAMYRQDSTGIERVTEAVASDYLKAQELALADGARPLTYVDAGDPDYSQIGVFDAAFDRLLIYPSNLLHSGIIPQQMPLVADPRRGRLTSNIFVTYTQK